MTSLRKAFLLASFLSFACFGAASASTLTIAALGDSLTAGYGLPRAEGLVPQLEAWLRARGHDVSIRNAGVSGDTTRGGRARVDWTLTPDVDAMIVTLGGNDVLRGLSPQKAKANLAAIIEAAQAKGVPVMLVGLTAPPNYGEAYKTAFNNMYRELADEYGTALHPNFFYNFFQGLERTAALDRFMQRDRIHPNAEGVAVVIKSLGPAVEDWINQIK